MLDAVTHGATHFTGNASQREQQDAHRTDRERQRANGQYVYPIDPSHGREREAGDYRTLDLDQRPFSSPQLL